MNRHEAIETLKKAIAQVEWDYPMEIAAALDFAIADMKICEANNAGWVSVKDRLPTESDGTVLVCYPNQAPYNLMEPHVNAKHDRRVATGCYSQYSSTWYHGDMRGVGGADPIAWMPLPEPMKEKEHDG